MLINCLYRTELIERWLLPDALLMERWLLPDALLIERWLLPDALLICNCLWISSV